MGVQGLKRIGLGITAIWVGVIAVYVWFGVEPESRPWNLAPNNFGDFLAGTVGPVAFFWLMLAFFIQSAQLEAQSKSVIAQEEALKATQQAIELQRQTLDLQREELKLQRIETAKLAEEAGKQAASAAATANIFMREWYLKKVELIEKEINRTLAVLFTELEGKSFKDKPFKFDFRECQRRIAEGEKDLYMNMLGYHLHYAGNEGWFQSLIVKENKEFHIKRVRSLLDAIFKEADGLDDGSEMKKIMEKTIFGNLQRTLSERFGEPGSL
jgi:hypothetical protein